ncbi:hypothetical protein IB232_01580 [Pseudomonas sp. PDM15]|uniref:hypothetical protein n=1 Tax=Pseudomonas sp. PDM15 TaxID=2769303 RepID=UPI0017818E21|nr:hypothetical protein [Pseudomonas sp. PDM15]MBD9424002.1 hypothetical protein [Pseudomonas sp. PDM15]
MRRALRVLLEEEGNWLIGECTYLQAVKGMCVSPEAALPLIRTVQVEELGDKNGKELRL